MSVKVYLFFLSGAKKGKIDDASGRVIRIGRQPFCEIQLDPYEDLPASGEHAQIVCEEGGGFTLHDLQSSWGTFKNDARLTGPVPLSTGDVITCGHDDTGLQGPRLKFYLEKDILRCPACKGPVYKRHFKCPDCGKKFCLRCVDFKRKVCKPCGQSKAGGYELVEDSGVQAKAPARVIVSGKDAERVKRAQQKKKEIKKTKFVPPPGDPGIVAEPVSLETPFCHVCCEFTSNEVFSCPVCKRDTCLEHKHGAVCPSCAGVKQGENPMEDSAFAAGSGTEPELRIPDLDFLDTAAPVRPQTPGPKVRRPSTPAEIPSSGVRKIPPVIPGSGVRRPPEVTGSGVRRPPEVTGSGVRRPPEVTGSGVRRPPEVTGSGVRRPPEVTGSGVRRPPEVTGSGVRRPPEVTGSGVRRPPEVTGSGVRRPAPPVPGQGPQPATPPTADVTGSGFGQERTYLPPESRIEAKRPPAIPCERCGAPLAAQNFFMCERCRARLCLRHRTGQGFCDRCASDPNAAPVPQFAPPPPRATPIPPTMRFSRPPQQEEPRTPRPAPADGFELDPDDLAHPPPGSSGAGGLEAVTFECPYCEAPLPVQARQCPRCKKVL